MVVFHSPSSSNQQQRRRPDASPLVVGHGHTPREEEEEEEDLIQLTPPQLRVATQNNNNIKSGAAAAAAPPSSTTAGTSASNLHQRLQASLQLVAASPSSKLNAPDPFRPSRELRRDHQGGTATAPTRAPRDGHNPLRLREEMEQGASTGHDDDSLGAEQEEQQEQEQSHTDKGGPSAAGKSPSTATALGPAWTQAKPNKNYDLAARALFDDRMVRGGGKGAESGQNVRRSSLGPAATVVRTSTASPLPRSAAAATPSMTATQSHPRNHRPRASLPDISYLTYRTSQPLRTPSNSLPLPSNRAAFSEAAVKGGSTATARSAATAGVRRAISLSPNQSLSIPTLAKFGRMGAEIASLKSDCEISRAEVRSLEEKYAHAATRLEREVEEKQRLSQRLAEHEELASEFERYLTEYEELKEVLEELARRHTEDRSELARLRDLLKATKWKERKLKNELQCRRAEEKWRESAVLERSLDQLECEKLDLEVELADTRLRADCAENERDYWKSMHDLAHTESQALESNNVPLQHQVKELEANIAKSATTITELTDELETTLNNLAASQTHVQGLEQANANLTARLERAEQAESKGAKESREEVGELRKKVKELEKALRKADSEKNTVIEDRRELRATLDDQTTEISLLNSKLKELDKKLGTSRREVEELQNLIAMQSRASKVFGSPAVGPTGAASTVSAGLMATGKANNLTSSLAGSTAIPASKDMTDTLDPHGDNEANDDIEDDNSYSLPPPLRSTVDEPKEKARQVPPTKRGNAKGKQAKATSSGQQGGAHPQNPDESAESAMEKADDDDDDDDDDGRAKKKTRRLSQMARKTSTKPPPPVISADEESEGEQGELPKGATRKIKDKSDAKPKKQTTAKSAKRSRLQEKDDEVSEGEDGQEELSDTEEEPGPSVRRRPRAGRPLKKQKVEKGDDSGTAASAPSHRKPVGAKSSAPKKQGGEQTVASRNGARAGSAGATTTKRKAAARARAEGDDESDEEERSESEGEDDNGDGDEKEDERRPSPPPSKKPTKASKKTKTSLATAAPPKKKIPLYGGPKTPFVWGSSTTGGGGGGGGIGGGSTTGILCIPDVLSPVKRST